MAIALADQGVEHWHHRGASIIRGAVGRAVVETSLVTPAASALCASARSMSAISSCRAAGPAVIASQRDLGALKLRGGVESTKAWLAPLRDVSKVLRAPSCSRSGPARRRRPGLDHRSRLGGDAFTRISPTSVPGRPSPAVSRTQIAAPFVGFPVTHTMESRPHAAGRSAGPCARRTRRRARPHRHHVSGC